MIFTRAVLVMLLVSMCLSRKPDKVYCGNQECSVPISKAKTLITYNSGDHDFISYKANSEALVFMKSAGTHPELWFAVINEHGGFVNSKFLREQKIFEKNPSYIITLPLQDQDPLQPERVQHPHEVLEGTTIYTTETTYDSHQASSTENTQNYNVALNDESSQMKEQLIEINTSNDESSMHLKPQTNSVNNNELPTAAPSSHVTVTHDVKSDSVPNSYTLPISANVDTQQKDGHANDDRDSNDNNPPYSDASEVFDRERLSTQVVKVAVDNGLENPQKQPVIINSEEIPVNPDNNNDLSQLPVTDDSTHITTNQPSIPTSVIPVETHKQFEESMTPVSVDSNNENPSLSQIQNIFTSSSGSISIKETPLSKNMDFVNMNIDRQNNDNFEKNDSSSEQTNNGISEETMPVINPDMSNRLINNGDSFDVEETVQNVNSYSSNPEKNLIYNNGVTEEQPVQHSDNTLNENNLSANVNLKLDTIPVIPKPNEEIPNINENIENLSNDDQISYAITTESPLKTLNDNIDTIVLNTSEDIETTMASSPSLDTPISPEIPASTKTPLLSEIPVSSETPTSSEIPASPEIPTLPKIPVSSETPILEIPASPETPALPEILVSSETPTSEIPASPETLTSPETPASPETLALPETYPNEPLEQSNFFANLYSAIVDIWTPTTVPPYIEGLSTTPEIHNTNFDNNDYNPQIHHKSTSEEKSFSMYNSMMSAYYMIFGYSENAKYLFASNVNDCFINEVCEDGNKEQNNRLTVLMLTTSVSVLLFSLGYYYIDKKRQDGRLVGTINSLQRDLLCSMKECEILQEELTSTKTKLAGIEDNSFGMDDMVQSLKEEIEELKAQNERLRNSLDDNEKLLRVSENTAGELQNTLSDVENTLSELLAERVHSEEQITELNGKIQAFEEELISVSRERDSFQLKYVSAESALEEAHKQKKNLEQINIKLQETENTIKLQKHEIAALKECIKDLKKEDSSNIDVASIIDHTELKAKLTKAVEEKSALEEKYSVEHKERTRLQEELHTTQQSLHVTSQQASEAVTRLEVLGKYFQERESELMKVLNAKETLWLSKQGESASTVEKIEALQQEVHRYKEKCDSLTLELAELESSKRTAIAELEARAHAAWLDARTARRDAAADRDAAATLRRKLASMSTQPEGAPSPQQRIASPLDNSGSDSLGMGVSVIPPPLPPIAFLPPLLPPLPRPPPLGRLPSPHPPRYSDRRYSPESRYSPDTARYSPDSRYSPEPVRARARYSPDSRYSPRRYSPPSSRHSRDRYQERRGSRQRNGPALDTETEYASDSPGRSPPPRRRYSHPSGPSSGSGCSSESEK